MRRHWVVPTAVVIAALLHAGAALAGTSSVYASVLRAYQASNGRIPPCEFTSPQLESARNSVDAYGQQYYADFIAAIQVALTARASGACAASHRHAVAAVGRSGSAGGPSGAIPGAPTLPSSITASTSSGLPLPLLVLVALGALLAAVAALARWASSRGWDPGWATWRHGAAEARYRTEGAWAQFRERLRR